MFNLGVGMSARDNLNSRLLRVVDEPEDDRVHVYRNGIFRQRRLGTKGRGLNALVDDSYDVVDHRNDQEQTGSEPPLRLYWVRLTAKMQSYRLTRRNLQLLPARRGDKLPFSPHPNARESLGPLY